MISHSIRCPPSGYMVHCILLCGEKKVCIFVKNKRLSDVSIFLKVFTAEQGAGIRRPDFFSSSCNSTSREKISSLCYSEFDPLETLAIGDPCIKQSQIMRAQRFFLPMIYAFFHMSAFVKCISVRLKVTFIQSSSSHAM